MRGLNGELVERERDEDGRLKVARHEVNWRRNITGVGDVHVSAGKGVVLCVRVSEVLLQLRVEGDR